LLIFWKQCYIITMEPNEGQNPAEINDSDLHALYNSGSEVTISFIKMLLDRIKSLEVAVKELKATGFKDIDIFYKYYNFGVIYGRKY
ncbi:MAG: hypothetical protein JXB88_16510, partial [Spirochaetales bacterium]|nr:hypothetical protein [Spirochaetales bacterium]